MDTELANAPGIKPFFMEKPSGLGPYEVKVNIWA